jgi:hypothetical protein
MVTKSTDVTARPESDKLNSARRAQGWPRVDSLSKSPQPGSHLARPFPLAGDRRRATLRPIGRRGGAWLTLIDLMAIAGLFLTTAFFYPAMAWLLLLP